MTKLIALLILVTLVGSNAYLISIDELAATRYLSMVLALPLGIVIYFRGSKGGDGRGQLSENISKAQELISEKSYGIFRYGNRRQTLGDKGYAYANRLDVIDILSTPLVWLLCLGVGLIMSLNPIYLESIHGDYPQQVKLISLHVLQLLLFSSFFCGLFSSIKNWRQ